MGEAAAEKPGKAAPGGNSPPGRRESSLCEYLESLLVTIILAVFGTAFIAQAFKIPSPSMEPTLLIGDHLLVNKFLYGGHGAWYERALPYRRIRRGDIVVFKFPYENHPYYVKRVIGLPGDRIKIINQKVYVNDTPLDEPYAVHDPASADPYMFDFPPQQAMLLDGDVRPEWAAQIMQYVRKGELVVPPRQYFVMGDNRDHSADSRYWGFVDRSAIVGRPLLVYWSIEASSREYSSRTFLGSLEEFGKMLLHFPTRTRWGRMFHEVH